MDLRPALGLTLFALFTRCASVPAPQPWTQVGPSRVLEVLNRRQCSGCHSVESVFGTTSIDEPAPPPACTRATDAQAGDPFCDLPTLASMDRFRARWLRSFFAAPMDLRPNLAEQMIDHDLTPAEIDTLVVGWQAEGESPGAPSPSQAALARGAALYRQKQCAGCHQFGDLPLTLEVSATPRQRALAPDLQHARLRLSRRTLERFILAPTAVKPTTEMPRTPLAPGEASALADFIYFAPLPLSPDGAG